MFRTRECTMGLIMADVEASPVECVTVLFCFVTNLGQVLFSTLALCHLVYVSPVASVNYYNRRKLMKVLRFKSHKLVNHMERTCGFDIKCL